MDLRARHVRKGVRVVERRPSGGLVHPDSGVENVRKFGVEPVVALNRFGHDTEAEHPLAGRRPREPLGQEVVRFALNRYGSVDVALNEFTEWKRSRKRFCELAPEWGLVTRRVVWAYPATQLLVEELQTMADDGIGEPTLVDLVEWLHVQHPTFSIELFLKGTDEVRSRLLTEDGGLRSTELADGTVFHSPTVFQLKAMLYHAGVLTERGAEPNRLDPLTDDWTLRYPLSRFR